MSAPQTTPDEFHITSVHNFREWFDIDRHMGIVSFCGVVLSKKGEGRRCASFLTNHPNKDVAVVRCLHDEKIGQVGCYWGQPRIPIEYKYAKIKLGDVFDFFTTKDGVLKIPDWCGMKYAVDQYLEEDPRIKFHPSRVQQFIDEHGIEQLETME